MKVVTTFHPSSSVQHSIKATLTTDPDLEFLVVAKLDRLHVHSIQPEGLKKECELETWGRIVAIKAVPVDDTTRSNLLIMLDHPDPELIFLEYIMSNNGAKDIAELKTLKYLSLYERSIRHAEFFQDIILDPSGNIAIASCYVGKVKVLILQGGSFEREFDVSLSELNLLDLAFIASGSKDTFTLALLHVDHEQRIQLLSRDLDISENEQLSPKPSAVFPPFPLSPKSFPWSDGRLRLVTVPPFESDSIDEESRGGILILGGKKIVYYELESVEAQRKLKGKASRTEKKKKNTNDTSEVAKAEEKEKERELRKRKPKMSVEWPWSDIGAWTRVGEYGSVKYLIGDNYGRLAMMTIGANEERRLTLVALGETSPATTLTYLTSQILFVGSHGGDSQIIQINPSPVSSLEFLTLPISPDISTISPSQLPLSSSRKGKGRATDGTAGKDGRGLLVLGKGSYLSVVNAWKNIAPIVDAVLVDTDGSGEKQIVTCSGVNNTGSLNVVRNGADFQALAVAEGLMNITSIWPIRAQFEDAKDTHILVSTLQESYLFRFDGSSRITRVSPSSTAIITNQPTLALANIPRRLQKRAGPGQNSVSEYVNSSLVVQITSTGVTLLEYDMALGQHTKVGDGWVPNAAQKGTGWQGRHIIVAAINPSQIVLGISGARLVLLNLTDKDEFNQLMYRDVGDATAREISAISCTPLNSEKKFTKRIAVSFWGSNRVKIFSLEGNLPMMCESPSLTALPRSLIFYNFGRDTKPNAPDYHPHLLVGLGDGNVVSYSLRNNELVDQKIISLGDLPVFLSTCLVDNRKVLFACGSRASILFWDRETLRHSPVILKDIVAASYLNTASFSSCLILATSKGLVIGEVKDLDKMHIRKIPLGLENPQRITYHASLKLFGVVCSRTEPARIGEYGAVTCSFKIFDDTSFKELGQYDVGYEEGITAVHSHLVPFEESSASFRKESIPCFSIASCRFKPGELEPSEGHILLFRVLSRDHLNPVLIPATSTQVPGMVHAIVDVEGMIAVIVNSSVIVFRIAATSDIASPSLSLHKVAEWNYSFKLTSLVVCGNTLMVGDAYHAVALLRLADSRLELIARSLLPLHPHSIQALDQEHVIGASVNHDLFSFSLQRSELQTEIERDGNFHTSDLVNKFVPGSLTSSDTSDEVDIKPEHLFFTSSGCIGVIINMGTDISLHMTDLQRNMAQIISGPGELSHTRFRAPRNMLGRYDAEASSFGFLDGDFLERYLDLPSSSSAVDKIMNGNYEPERLRLSREKIQKILERLQSLH